MRKLTISVSEEAYEGLYAKIGTGRINRFLDSQAIPHAVDDQLEEAHREMAAIERIIRPQLSLADRATMEVGANNDASAK